MLKAVFYARFHPERGFSVIHQYPPNSIRASPGHEALITWSDISSYIIPPYDLCNQPMSICTNGYRILTYPVSLEHEEYDRNRFTFNVCFVLAEDEHAHPWVQIVRKTARFFTEIEWDGCALQKEEDIPGLVMAGEESYPAKDIGRIYPLLSSIVNDLNSYGETCIRLDGAHVLNLRLEIPKEFAKDAPSKVRAWDVPLLVRSLPTQSEWTWDLTMVRIWGFIDGVRHVSKIGELADVEVKLVKRAIKELVWHGRAILLDLFHFQAIYAATEEMGYFVKDEEVQDECRRYVTTDAGDGKEGEENGHVKDAALPTRETILQLYTDLQPGLNLSDFCLAHKDLLTNIDIRRLITFGIIKGFLRRIHKFGLAIEHRPTSPTSVRTGQSNSHSNSRSKPKSNEDAVKEFDRAWKRAALSSGWATPPSGPHPASLGRSYKSADRVRSEEEEKLRGYLDGKLEMDGICVGMSMSEKRVLEKVRAGAKGSLGEVVLFNK